MPSQFGGAVDTNDPTVGLMGHFGPAGNNPLSGYNNLSSQQKTTVDNSTFLPVGSRDGKTLYTNPNGQYDIQSNSGSNVFTQALGLAGDVLPVAAAVATGGTSLISQLAQAAIQSNSNPGGTTANAGLSQSNSNNAGATNKMAIPTGGPQTLDNPQQGVANSTAGTPADWASLIASLGGLTTGLQQAYGSGQGSAAQASKLADPFQGSRQNYAQQMNALMADPSSVSTLPGYQFQLNQGLGAIRSAGTTQGSGGAEAQQAMQFGQGLASTSYETEFNNLGALSGATWGPTAGTSAANQLTGGQAAGQKAITTALAGNSGIINSGVNSLINGVGSGLQSLFNPGNNAAGNAGSGVIPGMDTNNFSDTQGGMSSAFNGQGVSGNTGDYSSTPGYPNYGNYSDPSASGAINLNAPAAGGGGLAADTAATDAASAGGGGDAVSSLVDYFSSLGGDITSSSLGSSFADVLGSLF